MNASSLNLPRFELSDSSKVCHLATRLAHGDWEGTDNPDLPRRFLRDFVSLLEAHGYYAIHEIVLSVQYHLMARRESDFITMQLDPAFTSFAFNNLVELDRAWTEGGDEGFHGAWNLLFSPGWESRRAQHRLIFISGGPGDSPARAFVIDAPDSLARIRAQYWYLNYLYGLMPESWRLEKQMLTVDSELNFDVMAIRLPNGERRNFYFLRNP